MGYAAYKTFGEVFLEATMAKYEEERARSPLERGMVVRKPIILTTCFAATGDQPVKTYDVKTPTPSVGPAPGAAAEDAGNESGASYYSVAVLAKGQESAARRGRAVVARWNQLQQAFSRHLELTRDWPASPADLSHPRMLDFYLSLAARLRPSDPRNVPISSLADRLALPETARRKLSQSGLATLRDLARYLRAAPTLEAHESRSPEQPAGPTARGRKRGARSAPSPAASRILLDRETRELILAALRKLPPASGTSSGRRRPG
jgi:hypothetical protein